MQRAAGQAERPGRRAGSAAGCVCTSRIVVDNRAGAAGALGGRNGADGGARRLFGDRRISSSITVAPLLQRAAKYEPLNDFDFVTLIALLPNVLVCKPALPVQSAAPS